MRVTDDGVELRATAARLQGDPYFMAWALAVYRAEFKLTDRQLAQTLRCGVEELVTLALCRAPRVTEAPALFRSDVQAISDYVGCDMQALVSLIRTVNALSALRESSGAQDDTLLKAARKKQSSRKGTRRKPGKR